MTSSTTSISQRFARNVPRLAGILGSALLAFPLLAKENTDHTVRKGWGEWWLPFNYAKHGVAIDGMFNFIFWLTMIVFIAVEVVLVYFLFKYKFNPNRKKAVYIHGNTRLEMIWTIIPAILLAGMAIASKGIWDKYRYAEDYDKTPQTEVMVIAEQFQWNYVYPGKDNKFGQYLAFPNPSAPKFRNDKFEVAVGKITKYNLDENPLGQNQHFGNSEAMDGQDDDYSRTPGRPLILPVGKPIAIRLSSKDVIHDFFLPNFRVKLDALPGMYGRVNFTAMDEAQSTEDLDLDKKADYDRLVAKAGEGDGRGYPIWIDANTPSAIRKDSEEVSQINYLLHGMGADGNAVDVLSRSDLSLEKITALKKAGVKTVTIVSKPFELVCEELCGQGHSSMRGIVWMVTPAQYKAFNEKPPVNENAGKAPKVASATTKPSVAAAVGRDE